MADKTEKVSVFVELFLQYLYVRKGRSKTTIDTYRSVLMFFVEYVEDCPLNEATVSKVDSYADSLSCYNFSSRTLRNRLTPIRSFFKFLYSKEYTDIRPESIDLPTIEHVEANFLEPDEQLAMINACKTPRERALVLFMMRSGVRVSELVNARAADLYNRSFVVRRGKGGDPRVTFITEEADEAVRDYHATLVPQTYLFPNASGGQISRQFVHRIIAEIAERAGIDKRVSPHTMRHTFATDMLRRDARAEDVQPMMGHKSIRTTLLYMHFTNGYLHSRYDKIMANEVTL